MKKQLFAYCIFSLFAYGSAHAHFFKVETMSTMLPHGKQTIILCSDYHYSDKEENKAAIGTQQNDIITMAKQLNATVIVEDGYVRNHEEIIHDKTATCMPEVIPQDELDWSITKTPLHGLASVCHNQTINCVNVESRFSFFRNTNTFLRYLENKKKIIAQRNDSASFCTYYKKQLNALQTCFEEPCKQLFDYFKIQDKTIDQILDNAKELPKCENIDAVLASISSEPWDYETMPYEEKIITLYTRYGCIFLDLDILHAVAVNSDKEYIIICAGDYHIERCMNALEDLGYSKEVYYGAEIAIVDGTDYEEPNAIDISLIEEKISDSTSHATPEEAMSELPRSIAFIIECIIIFSELLLYQQ